ncbi:MAG TPA: biotin transporter BioY [Actinomycetota bacterium]|nr:biotin transporter BioY [Actinomycetota bacterium]
MLTGAGDGLMGEWSATRAGAHGALADVWVRRGRARRHPLSLEVLVIVGASLVVAGAAQLSLRLPFTPVPVTLQTLAVLLVGAVLGARRGTLALLLYLAEGALGLPVFAEAKSGVLYLVRADPLHTTGGYLWGFVVAAALVGLLAQRRWDRSARSCIGAMLLGEIAVFAFGVTWLAAALQAPSARALELGLYPFVVAEVAKLLVAAAALPAAWRFVGIGGMPRRR